MTTPRVRNGNGDNDLTEMELVGLVWIPVTDVGVNCIVIGGGSLEDDGIAVSGGYAYFDTAIWEQRDGPCTKPYRRTDK